MMTMQFFLLAVTLFNCAWAAQLKMQCDDKVIEVFVDGAQQNQAGAGGNWQSVVNMDIADNAGVIAFKAYNNGGPGRMRVAIDGVTSQPAEWKCLDLKANPNANLVNYNSYFFDDSAWVTPTAKTNSWPAPNGADFPSDMVSWWTANQNQQYIACRKVNFAKVSVQCDDKVHGIFADGARIDIGNGAQSWQSTGHGKILGNDISTISMLAENKPGPGRCIVAIGGFSTKASDWQCIDMKANPDYFMSSLGRCAAQAGSPNTLSGSGVVTPAELAASWSQRLNQFPSTVYSWWVPNVQANQNIACSMDFAAFASRVLASPGTIHAQVDDDFKLYSNGQEVGSYRQWNAHHQIEVAAGTQTIAIKAHNGGGPKGIRVRTDFGLTTGANWLCKSIGQNAMPTGISDASNDGTWSAPVVEPATPGVNWPGKTASVGDAKWIWCSGNNVNNCICKIGI